MKYLLTIVLTITASTNLFAQEAAVKDGSEICVSSYTPRTSAPDELERVYMKVGKRKFFFKDLPRVAITGLKLNENHKVKIYFDDAVIASWDITFTSKLNMLNLWRESGHWRTELTSGKKCNQ
jgi:hypothetical protein